MQEKVIIINDLKIRYYASDTLEKAGVLVYLHGWKSEALHFRGVLENYPNFVAIDLPGFGGSERPKTSWALADYANFLKSFLEKLEIKNPLLAGHSFGGSVIAKYAAKGFEAKKLILIDSAGIRKRGVKILAYKLGAKIIKLILSVPGLNMFREKLRKKFYKLIDSEDYIEAGAMLEIYRKTISEDLSADLQKIQQETILIWGKDDSATPLWQAEQMHKLLKNSKLSVIENAGHFSFIDRPEKFKKIFFEEINAN